MEVLLDDLDCVDETSKGYDGCAVLVIMKYW
jgi:hypothetical protein